MCIRDRIFSWCKKMSEDQICSLHNRATEAFCMKCDGKIKPMCPICLCEHNEEKHGKGFVHITALIEEGMKDIHKCIDQTPACLLYTSPSPRDQRGSRMPSSA
eukprot:TRINITY_DN11617_c0_g2_i1.p2 TRINITY_DN11617_c0_g2~~TRINITY_DN11617_c0_g2_i1.p2  ORF type:complete len:103 (-),score=47.45 TRINITY_DN11617_c0_g2_i1:19-327(-)